MIETIDIKVLLKGFVVSFFVLLILFCLSCLNNQTIIVFCDVGQGDGAYIRIHNRFDVVIDAGPDRRILNCLGRYMPFYDRTIELAFISHDQKDHFGGFEYLLDRYHIKKIFIPDLESSLQSFKRLRQKMLDKRASVTMISPKITVRVLDDTFVFYWPQEHCVASDNNDCSLIFSFQERIFKILFTGDASPLSLNKVSKQSIRNNTLLKIPHHGSKNGLTEKFLQLANPRVAVISVGKNNPYGHPNKHILDMLESSKIKILRTDKDGDIVFKLPN